MEIKEFDWDVAYEKVTDFLRNIHAHDFIIATNKKMCQMMNLSLR